MGILSSKLPELPESVSDRFFITYKKYDYDNQYHYILTSIPENLSGEVEADYKVSSSLDCNWVLVNDEWNSTFLKVYSSYRNFYATDIVYSSYDMYTESGEFYYSRSNYDEFEVNVIGSSVSSSTIITSLRSEFLPVLLVIVPAFILIVGFRKAWEFIKGGVRGA